MLDTQKYWYPFGVAIRLAIGFCLLIIVACGAIIVVLFILDLRASLIRMKISITILYNLLLAIGFIYAFLTVVWTPPIIAMWILKPLGLKLVYNAVR